MCIPVLEWVELFISIYAHWWRNWVRLTAVALCKTAESGGGLVWLRGGGRIWLWCTDSTHSLIGWGRLGDSVCCPQICLYFLNMWMNNFLDWLIDCVYRSNHTTPFIRMNGRFHQIGLIYQWLILSYTSVSTDISPGQGALWSGNSPRLLSPTSRSSHQLLLSSIRPVAVSTSDKGIQVNPSLFFSFK